MDGTHRHSRPGSRMRSTRRRRPAFGAPAGFFGEGGSIPFMGMLGDRFPAAQFVVTGALVPGSNAHGPDEFLHLPTARRVTECIARLLGAHVASPADRADRASDRLLRRPHRRASRGRCRRRPAVHQPEPALGFGVVVADDLVATAAHTVEGPLRELRVDGVRRRSSPSTPAPTSPCSRCRMSTLNPPSCRTGAPSSATLLTPGAEQPVELVSTGPLVVHDTTAGVRHERLVHRISPAVASGTSGAPLVDDRNRVLGIVVLSEPADDVAYAVTARRVGRPSSRSVRLSVLTGSGGVPRLRSPQRAYPWGGFMRRSFSRFLVPVAVVALAVSACTSDDDDGAAEPSLPGATEAPDDTSDDAIAADDTAADTTTGDTEGTTADSAEEVQTGESILDTVIANDVVRCGATTPSLGSASSTRQVSTSASTSTSAGSSPPPCSATPPRSSSSTSPPRTASPRCSPARSTCSCATPRGRPAVTAASRRRSSSRTSTTVRG